MLVSISGTPGVGKTTVSKEMEKAGWRYIDLRALILESGSSDEIIHDTGEVLVDELGLRNYLGSFNFNSEENIVLDGHLSYLAPSDVCIVLRLDPRALNERLMERDYSKEKIKENVEAEAISVILVEALELEKERLKDQDWDQLPSGCGIVFEVDASDLSQIEAAEKIIKIIDAYQGKRLNDLLEYRPGRIDWLEEMIGWF